MAIDNMKQLNIVLVAHDARKKEFVEWVQDNIEQLRPHHLLATGTTGRLITEIVAADGSRPFANQVERLLSGPLGGDQQIGAMIAQGRVDVLIFFCDNLVMQGHQNDVSALTRLASLYNIAFATNRTTADLILSSRRLAEGYEMQVPQCVGDYAQRDLNECM